MAILDELPPELLHTICSLLPREDIRNIRRITKQLAEVAGPYLIPHLHVRFENGFANLESVSGLPGIATGVRAITYSCLHISETALERRIELEAFNPSKLSLNQLLDQWHNNEERIFSTNEDFQIFSKAIRLFPNLDAISILAGDTNEIKPDLELWDLGLLTPRHGIRQLAVVSLALAEAGKHITTLQIKHLHAEYFQWDWLAETGYNVWRSLVHLDLYLVPDTATDRHCGLRSVLRSLQNLRHLRIDSCDATLLSSVIDMHHKWPSLEDLYLEGFESTEEEMCTLLGPGGAILNVRTLSLGRFTLHAPSWVPVMERIRRRNFNVVKLSNYLKCNVGSWCGEELLGKTESWLISRDPEYSCPFEPDLLPNEEE